jgi:hypothetical protein
MGVWIIPHTHAQLRSTCPILEVVRGREWCVFAETMCARVRVECRSAGGKRCSKRSVQKWLTCRLDVKCLGNPDVAMLARRRAPAAEWGAHIMR